MAYFERFTVPATWSRERHHRYGRIVCDPCAGTPENPGLVTFRRVGTFSDGSAHHHQEKPWCWAPWAMGQPCDGCGRTDAEIAVARSAAA